MENYHTCLKFVDGVFIFLDVFQNSHFDVAIGTIFLMQLSVSLFFIFELLEIMVRLVGGVKK